MKLKYGLLCGILAGGFAFADAPVLTWDGGAVWDAASVSWVDESGAPSAWVPGAVAKFDGAGGFVEVSADVEASGLVFASGGYALVGHGRIRLEGEISVAGGLTNSVGVELFSANGIEKTGAGAVALGQCVGRVTVTAGDLLATASQFADAQVEVAAGARVVTAGEPDRALNVVRNAGFEEFNLAPGGWAYTSTGAILTEWCVAVSSNRVGGQNLAAAGSPWNSAGMAPEGDKVLILQMEGAVTQEVAVAQAGWHQVALSHFLRSGYQETVLYVTVDGAPLAMIFNDAWEGRHKRFVSVPFWLGPGAHVLGLAGEGDWSDRATMVDDVVLAPAFSAAAACRALGGDSEVRLAAGAFAVLGHDGNLEVAKLDAAGGAVSGPGAWGETTTGLWFEHLGGAWAPPLVMGGEALLRIRDSATLTVEGAARRVWASGNAVLGGTGLTITNEVPVEMSHFSVSDGRAVAVTAPLALRARTVLDVFGALRLDGSLSVMGAIPSKRGFGEMAFPQPLALTQHMGVLEGRLCLGEVTAPVGTRFVYALSLPGRSVNVVLDQAGAAHHEGIVFCGSGLSVVSTELGGGAVSLTGHPRVVTPSAAVFDVAGGDTLSFRQLVIVNEARYKQGGLLKAGGGTLEIREGGLNTGAERAYQGRTTLRNGTLRVLADDTGDVTGTLAYNGAALDGRGGSLGAGPLSDAVRVGDAGTLSTDNLTFVASGNKRYIGHDFEVFDYGGDVRFEVADSADTMFAGTFTLHRDVTFAGANDAHLTLGSVIAAQDYRGVEPLALEGFSRVTIRDALDGADINLDIGARTLRLGVDTLAASRVNAFSAAGGTIGMNFGGGACSSLHAAAITLGETVFSLYLWGSDLPFNETGVFTLMTCSGTMSVDPNDLSVANAMPGFTYTFDVAGGALTLTVENADPGLYTAWKSNEGGLWDTGANWDTGDAPDSPALTALMGAAITNHAEVTLGAPFTVGSLLFNNPFWGYTLTGGTLAFGGSDPYLGILSGAHTIANTLDAAAPLTVEVAAGKLTLAGQAAVRPQVLLAQGAMTLADEAALQGGLTMGDTTALTVNGANTSIHASLEGAAQGALALQAGSRLTVNQTAAGAFSGMLTGGANTEIVRTGSGAWTLEEARSLYQGVFRQTGGETVLAGASLLGPVTADAGTALTFAPAATNGLMGYFYYVGNRQVIESYSNAFLSVAALENFVASRGAPDLISPSGLDHEDFDYPQGQDLALTFPYPFGTDGTVAGPHQYDFIAVWRGSITVPETGVYRFGVFADDYVLFAIDGEVVHGANRFITGMQYGKAAYLTAGRHDILAGLGQLGGDAGIRLHVWPPSAPGYTPLPNDWLTPMPTVGAPLNSAGPVAVQGGANVRVGEKGSGVLTGGIGIAAGGLLEKAGPGTLDVRDAPAGQAAGDVSIRSGSFILWDPDWLTPASRLNVYEPGTAILFSAQTVAHLSGRGLVQFGGATLSVTPFTNETDCEISPVKTYTHLLDFPTNQTPATVNGVLFGQNAGVSFSVDLTIPGNTIPPSLALLGMDKLLSGFHYAAPDYTFHLSGLQPFAAYETRLYFQKWESGNPDRNVTFTFSVGGNVIGETTYNIDFAGNPSNRHLLRCSYITDATGTLDVRVLSHTAATCHLFALTNEELGGSFGDALTLTVTPPDGTEALYAGSISGYGTAVVDGPGTQRFSGTNALSGALAVLSGEAALEPGALIRGAPDVAAGAALSALLGGVTLGGLTGEGAFATIEDYPPQTLYQHFFTDDATTLISPRKTYTHKMDFGGRAGGPAVVNGVPFDKVGNTAGEINGYGWDRIAPGSHGGNTSTGIEDTTQGIHDLLTDMLYGAQNNPETDAPGFTRLTGLTPGQQYELRIYNRVWEPNALATGGRRQTVYFVPDPAVTNIFIFEQDLQPPNFLAYRYTPTGTTLTIINETHALNATWHLYALTNEEVHDSPVVFDMTEDSAFSGASSGTLPWAKRGPGTLLFTGSSTATGPVTVEGGALGVGSGGTATLGPVTVQDGALLFGHGTFGGDVTLEDGAGLKWHYASAAQADTAAIDGTLTLPPEGIVHAVPLTPGVKSPTKWPLLISPAPIDGPADLALWTVAGIPTAKLIYNPDRTAVYLSDPRGTLILLR